MSNLATPDRYWYPDSQVPLQYERMAFNKRVSYDRETCQLLQYPIAPPRTHMAVDLSPGGLPLHMAKPLIQQKLPFTSSAA